MLTAIGAIACPFEKFGDSPQLRIMESSWVIDTWGQACGLGVSGGMEIRAENQITHEIKIIVALNDIIVTTIASDKPNTLTVTLPNLVDIEEAATEFADVTVAYKYTPYDDPEARANFYHWKHHPEDPQARNWYCQNILAKMDPVNRASWNKIIGESYPSGEGSGRDYCPEK
ncbi:MAG TPA: hypothetical protein VHT04_10895 [Stellaceae bacterium]|nr:hypothetical protein [Stellaceae bacterium]